MQRDHQLYHKHTFGSMGNMTPTLQNSNHGNLIMFSLGFPSNNNISINNINTSNNHIPFNNSYLDSK